MPTGDSPIDLSDLSIAVAHWHVRDWGGAEYLVTRLAEALDSNTVYTIGSPDPDSQNPFGDIEFVNIASSLSVPSVRRVQRRFDRTFEYAQWEDIDWREYGDLDIVITSGSTPRAVITPDDTLHINYCHSPPRWFYDLYHDRKSTLFGVMVRPLIRYLRTRDMTIDPRVDYYLVNSPIIKRRLWKFYKRESDILYPPIDIDSYYTDDDEDYYLHLGRLDVEKGISAILTAFIGSDHKLILAGGMGNIQASDRQRISQADNIEFRGFVDDDEKFDLLARCRAVVFNGQNEDFGIVPIEANASGKPVLARDDGFPSIFIDDGQNGLFHDGTPAEIKRVVEQCSAAQFDAESITDRAKPFSYTRFRQNLRTLLSEKYAAFDQLTSM